MAEELKPCPFCGSKDIHAGHNLRNHHEEIFCDDCGAEVSSEDDHQDAVRMWNTRVTP